MSVKVMGRVWELKLPHSHMLVLLALADHADHEGDNIYPSVGLVAWKCGYSERQVQRIIAELLASGVLVEVSAEPGKTVVYRIDTSKGMSKSPYKGRQNVTPDKMSPVKMSPVTSTTRRGDIAMSPGGVTFATSQPPHSQQPDAANPDPNRHVEPSIEPSSPPVPIRNGKTSGGGDGDEKKTKTAAPYQPDPMRQMLRSFKIGASAEIAQLYRDHYPDLDVETVKVSIENQLADKVTIGAIVRWLREDPPEPGKPYPRARAPNGTSPPLIATKANIAPDALTPTQLGAFARSKRNA